MLTGQRCVYVCVLHALLDLCSSTSFGQYGCDPAVGPQLTSGLCENISNQFLQAHSEIFKAGFKVRFGHSEEIISTVICYQLVKQVQARSWVWREHILM